MMVPCHSSGKASNANTEFNSELEQEQHKKNAVFQEVGIRRSSKFTVKQAC